MIRVVSLALAALLLLVGGSTWLALYPTVPADRAGARDLDSLASRVTIPVGAADGVEAWLLPGAGRGVIVLLAGYARDHRRLWRYASFLRRDGYTLLAVDFRSARAWARKPTTLGAFEREDLEAVLDWLARDPRTCRRPLGILAESLGASVALAAAANHPEIAAVVADCPFSNGRMAIEDAFACVLHLPAHPLAEIARAVCRALTGRDPAALDATEALRRLDRRPVLLLQTRRGERFSTREVDALSAAAGPGVEGWTVNDCGHNQLWLAHRAEYEARVGAFFARNLRGASLWSLERAPARR